MKDGSSRAHWFFVSIRQHCRSWETFSPRRHLVSTRDSFFTSLHFAGRETDLNHLRERVVQIHLTQTEKTLQIHRREDFLLSVVSADIEVHHLARWDRHGLPKGLLCLLHHSRFLFRHSIVCIVESSVSGYSLSPFITVRESFSLLFRVFPFQSFLFGEFPTPNDAITPFCPSFPSSWCHSWNDSIPFGFSLFFPHLLSNCFVWNSFAIRCISA